MSEGESPAVEEQGLTPASLPPRSEVQLCLRRFASLRSAERALSSSITQLRDDAWQKRDQQLRQRLEELAQAWKTLDAAEVPDLEVVEAVQNGFVEAATEITATGEELRRFTDDVQAAQLRSTLPAISQRYRKEVGALLDLLIEDTEGLVRRRATIEYIVTLLATSDESGTRKIAHDPVQLTPTMQALCERIEVECGDVSQEYELAFFEAANLDSEVDALSHVRVLRDKKEELGTLCFLPGVLRSIVTYNTRMANRMSDAVSTSREDDLAFEDLVDEAPEPATQSNDEQSLDFVEPELKAEPTAFVSIHDSNGISQIVEALQRRLRDIPIGSCASERIALSLDVSNLDSDERKILECTGSDADSALTSVLLVGLLSVVFPAIEEALLELGITRQQVHEDWAQELDQEIQERMSTFLAANEYESACQLAEFKTAHLYASLSSLARERRDRDGIQPRDTNSSAGSDTAKADMIAAAREAQADLKESGSRGWVTPAGNIAIGEGTGQKIRAAFAAVAVACLLVVVGLNWINTETPDTTNLRPKELSDISPYLKTAYRNGNGSGALVIGLVDPEWHTLSNELQVEAVQDMKIRLAVENVQDAMIYDAKRQLQIQVASGKIRRPTSGSGR
jgi:hypothetical protein